MEYLGPHSEVEGERERGHMGPGFCFYWVSRGQDLGFRGHTLYQWIWNIKAGIQIPEKEKKKQATQWLVIRNQQRSLKRGSLEGRMRQEAFGSLSSPMARNVFIWDICLWSECPFGADSSAIKTYIKYLH